MEPFADNDSVDGVAIVGMAGRFPGAPAVRDFWRNLLAGVESISRFEHGDLEPAALEDPASCRDPQYVRARGILEGVELFDAEFFRISPVEAQILDPQQRLFLEAAWEALEDAGCDPERYAGSIGVFAGMSNNTYHPAFLQGRHDIVALAGALQTMMGNEKDYLATRVAYKLNLRGPALNIQTACSSSLVAVCQAFQSLVSYQCDMALAGGVSIALPQKRGYLHHEGAITSSDGHCRAFDRQAAGTVFSNGLAIVALKRLSDAVAHGDHVYAVIKGTALNNDGSNKVSFLAPSVDGHAEAVTTAQAYAQIDPKTVGFIEAHGTGTELGDTIEVAALTQAFRERTPDTGFCALGSVKTNIGHLDAAAGVAGLIKAALAVHHGVIPPTLHFRDPNPKLELDRSPFYVNTSVVKWPEAQAPRRAGVSSLGTGGTNAHVVLEEAPDPGPPGPSRDFQVLPISARTPEALERATVNLRQYIEEQPEAALADVAWTLQTGRRHFAHRRAFVVRDRHEAVSALRARPMRVLDGAIDADESPLGLVLVGSRVPPGTGQQLYEQEPAYREAFDQCADILTGLGEPDLRHALRYAKGEVATVDGGSPQPSPSHTTLFAVEYATSRLWMKWGCAPKVMVVDAVGEYVAAVIAGVLSLADALALLVYRSAHAQTIKPAIPGQSEQTSLRPSAPPTFEPGAMTIPWVSALTGEWVPEKEVGHRDYWQRRDVAAAGTRLEDALARASETETVLLSVGPLAAAEVRPLSEGPNAVIFTFQEARLELQSVAEAVAHLWLRGAAIDWPAFHGDARRRRVPLPTYPFERSRYWIDPPAASGAPPERTHAGATTGRLDPAREDLAADPRLFVARLRTLLSGLSGVPEEQLDPSMPFLELGLDSLFLTQACTAILRTFGVKVTFRDLLEDLTTIEAIAGRLVEASASEPRSRVQTEAAGSQPEPQGASRSELAGLATTTSAHDAAGNTVERLIAQQLDVMRAQLEALRHPHVSTSGAADLPRRVPAVTAPAVRSAGAGAVQGSFGPYKPVDRSPSGGLTERQLDELRAFERRYTARTAESKRLTARSRRRLADPRSVAGFRATWKELVYPIVVTRSAGSRIWDIDGNEYVDLVNGFGTNLFGHSPSFVTQAIGDQLKRGIEIGPQSPLAGPVATLLCDIVGHERAAFCNTGSEAVMAAVRMARTVTARDTIVMFGGAYHGIFDEVLARGTSIDGQLRAVPIAPGIPGSACENVIVLEYGSQSALDILAARGAEIAAVLVEPVQSRRPDLQPAQFLRDLRQITAKTGTALIFDEVVTGFRVHPGGVQALFDVKPDLAIYGKVLGGGLPIGVVAGKATYLDALDGGTWEYGDASAPEVGMTFFAGTFVRHPLALAAAWAVLNHLKAEGAELQRGLNLRASRLVEALKSRAEQALAPVRVSHFSSWFCFSFPSDIPCASLFFAFMREKGVHVWEGRPGFISTAHTDDDLDRIVDAFAATLAEMQAAGFLPGGAQPPLAGARLGKNAEGKDAWFVLDPDRPGKYLQVGDR